MSTQIRGALACALLAVPATAAAEPTEVGAWAGPRLFSDNNFLGYINDAPAHPTLRNGMVVGVRVAKPLFPWLVPEFELPVSFTKTTELDVSVTWLNPRVQLRFEFLPTSQWRPFLVVGGGATIALSQGRRVFASDILGDGYVGTGLHWAPPQRRWGLRADARISVEPGINPLATIEAEVGLGGWLLFGADAPKRPGPKVDPNAGDPDADGLVGEADVCPDRAEDHDGHDDRDGCPDIDNDLDLVLDTFDRCVSVPETINGYDDEDGCPDTVPPEIEALTGTVEGLLYAINATEVSAEALASVQTIAELLRKHPSVQVQVVGHTDDREALLGVAAPGPDDPALDVEALSEALARRRAEEVKRILVAAGIKPERIWLDSKGRSEPVGDNDTERQRRQNRRVEIRRFVPPRL